MRPRPARLSPTGHLLVWSCVLGLLALGPISWAAAASVSPRELFQLGGVGQKELDTLVDGEPWSEANTPIIRRMLYRMQRDVTPGDMEHWSHGSPNLKRLAQEPEAYRLEVFELRGRLVSVTPYALSHDAERGGQPGTIWRCQVQLNPDGELVEILVAKVPEAWGDEVPRDDSVGAFAFFLKQAQGGSEGPAACFLTERLAWYPETYLGQLGMDVGLLDEVLVEAPPRPGPNGEPPKINWEARKLTETDHECFYQMLSSVGSAQPEQLSRWAQGDLRELGESGYSVVPLFNSPQTQQGRLVELSGVARRIVPVRVAEDDVMRRFGLEEYYQIYLFTDDSQDNPVVFCLTELPEGLPLGDGPGFGEAMTVAGFFFKTWSYQNSAIADGTRPQRQLAPLLIGRSAHWHPLNPPTMRTSTRIIGTVALLVALGVVWFVLRRFARGDRNFERQVRRRRPLGMSQVDWETFEADGDDA